MTLAKALRSSYLDLYALPILEVYEIAQDFAAQQKQLEKQMRARRRK